MKKFISFVVRNCEFGFNGKKCVEIEWVNGLNVIIPKRQYSKVMSQISGIIKPFQSIKLPSESSADAAIEKRMNDRQKRDIKNQKLTVCAACNCTHDKPCVTIGRACSWTMVDYVNHVGLCSKCYGILRNLVETSGDDPESLYKLLKQFKAHR